VAPRESERPSSRSSRRSRDRKPRSRSRSSRRARARSRSRDKDGRGSSKRSSRRRSKERSPARRRSKDRDRSSSRRHSSRRSRSRSRSSVRIVRRRKKSNFDVRPPGVTEENAAAYAAQAILQQNMALAAGGGGPGAFGAGSLPPSGMPNAAPQAVRGVTKGLPAWNQCLATNECVINLCVTSQNTFGRPYGGGYGGSGGGGGPSGGYSQQTRHARRLYVGGIGDVNETEITEFFNDVIDRALGERQEGGAVVSVYINRERHFAFVELRTIELTTACMNLDGVSFRGMPLKVRRPNDYNPATVPTEVGPIPQLNLAALGIVSTTVSDGPGKVFIGGLPYHLNEEQVKELLQAFGPLRSFHLVKELNSNLSKGYGFCEYMDLGVTDAACLGLNGMLLGDKTLTVRRAMSQENAKAVASAAGTVNSGLEMGLDPSLAAMQVMSLAGLGIPAAPAGTPSRVIVLLNMVTPEELEDDEEYSDIVDDIKTECERFGQVPSLLLPRPRDGIPSAVGKVRRAWTRSAAWSLSVFSSGFAAQVFVEFGDVQSAQNAAAELHGRGFSNRTVIVEYMDEQKYARRELA
jgi:splicing factor U2AF subunit